MGSIIGIPSTRVSDMFIRQRVVNQSKAKAGKGLPAGIGREQVHL